MKALRIALTALSALASAFFIFVGAGVAFNSEAPALLRLFGLAPLVYGLATAGLLFLAWKQSRRPLEKIATGLVAVFFLFLVIGSMDNGSVNGMEWVGIGFSFVLTLINWFAVRFIVRNRAI